VNEVLWTAGFSFIIGTQDKMKLLKPKFWDKDKISMCGILLFPISLFVKLLTFLKNFLLAKSISLQVIDSRKNLPLLYFKNLLTI